MSEPMLPNDSQAAHPAGETPRSDAWERDWHAYMELDSAAPVPAGFERCRTLERELAAVRDELQTEKEFTARYHYGVQHSFPFRISQFKPESNWSYKGGIFATCDQAIDARRKSK